MSTRVSEELESLQDKLMDLEKHNFAPIPEDSGTEAAALMRELDRKIEIMQSEINKLKVCAVHGFEILKELHSIPESAG